MLQRLYDFFCALIPAKGEAILMAVGAGIGAVATFAFGTIDDAVIWLFAFIATDYITGTAASFKLGEWSSPVGFVGLFKKFIILAVVSMCHGLDAVCGTELLRNVSIFAYCLNEFGSIIENIERLGFGGMIPNVLRRGLAQLREKEEGLFNDEKGSN